MSYQVLARKWRPRRFEELQGQEHVVRALVNALDHDRLHHAFLFTGTRGVGKTTIARILAKSLNCERGVSSRPCGTCPACVEVDEGRFVDLIEVDAASRTRVDDTRELLDNVQYAPTRGRYKVYLVDEVHMLSGHSFNALLKTLEEPPPHVKFLLATTDPQKLPVTVLSRCLQFNLKRLTPELIGAQLHRILEVEQIPAEGPALELLARAADGSMRDALSLLDQAIAYGGGGVTETDVRHMLGSIDPDAVERVLTALAAADAPALLGAAAHLVEYGVDLEGVLDQLAAALHRIALAQLDAALVGDDAGREQTLDYARRFMPEDVQLYYQIALTGKRDLPLAPDPRTGFEMTLLRMLAFRPADATVPAPPAAPGPTNDPRTAAPTAPAATPMGPRPVPAASPPSPADTPSAGVTTPEGWADMVAALRLSGFVRELANNTTLESASEDQLTVVLDEACSQLNNKERQAEFAQALAARLGRPVRLTIRVGRPGGETPTQARARQQTEQQQAAVTAIQSDPNVRAIQESFNARVNPGSIRPKA